MSGVSGGGGGMGKPDFESAEQTITVNSKLDVAHGLGVVPNGTDVFLKVKTAFAGYAVDELIPLAYLEETTNNMGGNIIVGNTNISIITASTIQVLRADTYISLTVTTANLKYVVRAWK